MANMGLRHHPDCDIRNFTGDGGIFRCQISAFLCRHRSPPAFTIRRFPTPGMDCRKRHCRKSTHRKSETENQQTQIRGQCNRSQTARAHSNSVESECLLRQGAAAPRRHRVATKQWIWPLRCSATSRPARRSGAGCRGAQALGGAAANAMTAAELGSGLSGDRLRMIR